MDQTTDLLIPRVNERDIDLLLLEEFLSSVDFGTWFIARLDPDPGGLCCVDARRSVTQANVESDTEVDFRDSAGCRLRVLIENKVGASLQPQQAERYLARGEHYRAPVSATPWSRSLSHQRGTSQIAKPPRASTAASTTSLCLTGSREPNTSARAGATKQPCSDARSKKACLDTSPWRTTLSPRCGAATGAHRELAPELEMREPFGWHAKAGLVLMRAPRLASIGVRLRHKIKKGKVDLELPGMGRSLNAVHATLEHLLEDGMSIQQAQESAAVRIKVPALSTVTKFDRQRKAAAHGVRAVKRMLAWAVAHQAAVWQLVAKA